eukprot:m.35986 g.35986  ORF g.35986 m.35986 type:complete len:328 (+) comp5367_c0_seq3:43-1026(+)
MTVHVNELHYLDSFAFRNVNELHSLDSACCLCAFHHFIMLPGILLEIIRKLIIDMVLSTDMAKHTKFLGEFNTLVRSMFPSGAGEASPTPEAATTIVRERLRNSFDDRSLVLCHIVHSADLGGSTKPWPICRVWTDRVMNEFFLEGDEERERGLELGAMNDREKLIVPKTQVGFINFIATPLWEAWGNFTSPNDPANVIQLRHLRYNLDAWKALIEDPSCEIPNPPFSDVQPSTPPLHRSHRRRHPGALSAQSSLSQLPIAHPAQAGQGLVAPHPPAADLKTLGPRSPKSPRSSLGQSPLAAAPPVRAAALDLRLPIPEADGAEGSA